MQFFIVVLLICLLVFLYCVYLLANDDFIFLRRDVTMERLFNVVFLGSMFSLFSARLFYGLFEEKSVLSNPFVFLLFPYFPGLSIIGSVLGIVAFFGFLQHFKKDLPLGRLADFFSISFLVTLPIGTVGYFMFSDIGFPIQRALILVVVYIVLFVVFLRSLLPQLLKDKIKEGTIALIFLIAFSLVNLVDGGIGKDNIISYALSANGIALILVFAASLGLLIKQENLPSKFKR
ncbi:MAG: prolipoprotein diacylglyceryl transferase [Candidatus Levybacteria bacterium]|nr:prolipoprotein diacylglyceryl transferase [Candidatus Levybacteria bacterium]